MRSHNAIQLNNYYHIIALCESIKVVIATVLCNLSMHELTKVSLVDAPGHESELV